ncbi:ATP-dependent RNA helicase HrpA [Candidatus Desulfarcum epimagneticum]|uniref:ATP-dependent RNA helicase HrpA n=1 Tax=uncultured Desulfobacteraceae bacterium TaxID=218296 RepID=A0A484HCN7_9BACT|nr:ATP-dependent RNA helicase HrpA [uncultured Desulfobacteraceae bacterium]
MLSNIELGMTQSNPKKSNKKNTGRPDAPRLPILDKKKEIIAAIQNSPATIISGATGSGKSTRLPGLCLEAGLGAEKMIGCTQPRRIAAVSIAARIASEMGQKPGGFVGHKIRFENKTRKETRIKIMTDGVLLAETQSDPRLSRYDAIIVDEAHERSLNIDFILGFLRGLLDQRPDLRVVIASATIDAEKFSKAFDDAPVIEIPGRMFPVETLYFPIEKKSGPSEKDTGELHYVEAAADAVEWLYRKNPRGDILIFMPTERDIHETFEILKGRDCRNAALFPLYARLPGAAQAKVFKPLSRNKIVIATNVAETSLTIPGIKYVIDSGLARISRYSPALRATSLPVDPISQSSANQRLGRCGRVEKGVCVRLYSKEDFEKRPVFTPPEILRANLAEVILRMIALKLGNVADFPFIDIPAPRSVRDGFKLLLELGAIARKSGSFVLTGMGRLMARLPADPRLSRILMEAKKEGCVEAALVIVSVLSIRDPRQRPPGKSEEAENARLVFTHPLSDFMTCLNLWRGYREIGEKGRKAGETQSRIRKKEAAFCRRFFLSHARMREWRDIFFQLSKALGESGFYKKNQGKKKRPADPAPGPNSEGGRGIDDPLYGAVHRSILSGFLSNIAVKKDKNLYLGAKGKEPMLFPGSVLFNREKPWIVASEMVRTSRLFARTAGAVDPAWLEKLGGDLCRYSYSNPRWEKNRGEVVADEQAALFGLVILSGRKAPYGPIDPETAHDIFIQKALVEGDIRGKFGFLARNRKMAEDALDVESRLRKRGVAAPDEAIADFYKARLPGVVDARGLARIIRRKKGDGFLRMSPDHFFLSEPDEKELSQYPDALCIGRDSYPCAYDFKPGKEKDGLTVTTPAAKASPAMAEPLAWLVPGLLKEKIALMIKNLPKAGRKALAPAAQTAEIIAREMPREEKSLKTALSAFALKRFNISIPASQWSEEGLPDHLRARVSITGPGGGEIAAGRDLSLLGRVGAREAGDPDSWPEIRAEKAKWERTGIVKWDFPDLPPFIEVRLKNGSDWRLFPGLESREGRVRLRLFSNSGKALASHREGALSLCAAVFSKDLKFLKKSLSLPPKARKWAACFGGVAKVEKRLFDQALRWAFFKDIRTRRVFEDLRGSVFPAIPDQSRKIQDGALAVMEAHYNALGAILSLETTKGAAPDFFQMMKKELECLAPVHFMEIYDTGRLRDIARYISALAVRTRRGPENPEKDRARQEKINIHSDRLSGYLKSLASGAGRERKTAVESFYWLLEEYKVSLFAQELKTAVPVSEKRLKKKADEIDRMA